MEIKHVGGSITDTGRLNDIEAMSMEKIQELLDLFAKFKVPFVIRFNTDGRGNRFCGAFSFRNGKDDHPERVMAEMYSDWVRFWESMLPGYKVVIMKQETYDVLRDSFSQ